MHFFDSGYLIKKDIARSQKIVKQSQSDLYFATRFLPEQIKHASLTLRAFDESSKKLLDDQETNKLLKIGAWAEAWLESGKNNSVNTYQALNQVLEKYHIPKDVIEDYLAALAASTEELNFKSRDEFENWLIDLSQIKNAEIKYVAGYKSSKLNNQNKFELPQLLSMAINLLQILKRPNDHDLGINNILIKGDATSNIDKSTESRLKSSQIKYYCELMYTWLEEALPQVNDVPHPMRLYYRMQIAALESLLLELESQNYDLIAFRKARLSIKQKFNIIQMVVSHFYKYDRL